MRISIIIPTCGRNNTIRNALDSIIAFRPEELGMEVLVVDNNNQENFSKELIQICEGLPDYVRYVAEPSPGLSAARHRGAIEAQGEILTYIDDDVLVSRHWAEAITESFIDPDVAIIGGPSIPVFNCSIPAWFWGFVEPTRYGGWSCGWISLLDIGHDVSNIDPIWIWGLNFSIRKEVLFEIGGFNPDTVPRHLQRWQGDGETGLAYKAIEAGVRSEYNHDVLLHHVIDSDRLSQNYFNDRAHYQGVCDSFTRIRSGQPPQIDQNGPKNMPASVAPGWPEVASEIRLSTINAYNKGWLYHQKETALDPDLLAWVRREHYINADIPEELAKT